MRGGEAGLDFHDVFSVLKMNRRPHELSACTGFNRCRRDSQPGPDGFRARLVPRPCDEKQLVTLILIRSQHLAPLAWREVERGQSCSFRDVTHDFDIHAHRTASDRDDQL